MLNCHCRDCQQASGSAYAAIVVVPKTAVQIRGEPRYHKVVGKAGKPVERGFCPQLLAHLGLVTRSDLSPLSGGKPDIEPTSPNDRV